MIKTMKRKRGRTRILLAVGLAASSLVLTEEPASASALVGAWVLRAPAPSPRSAASAYAVPQGIFVIGDYFDDVRASSALLYDIGADSWSTPGAPMGSHTRTLGSAQLTDGRIAVVGGGSAAADLWDPATQTWAATAPMSAPRDDVMLAALSDGRLLAVGRTGPDAVSAEAFDPSTGAWSPAGSPGATTRPLRAAQLPSGDVLVVFDNSTITALWHPTTGLWSPGAPLPELGFPVVAGGGRVLALGGGTYGGGSFGHRALAYDEVNNSWKVLADTLGARSLAAAVVLPNGDVLAASSNYESMQRTAVDPFSRSAEIYDAASGVWSGTGRMNAGHALGAAVIAGGNAYVFGGWEGAGTTLEMLDLNAPVPLSSPSVYAEQTDVFLPGATRRIASAAFDLASDLPLRGKPVRMEALAGGPSAGTVLECEVACMTDENGSEQGRFRNDSAAGTDTVRVAVDIDNDGSFAGDPETIVDVVWRTRPTRLTAFAPLRVGYEAVGLAAVLLWEGRPVVGRTVTFYPLLGSTQPLCSVVTDSKGYARCGGPLEKLAAVRGQGVRAEFAGDAMYEPSSGAASVNVI